MSAVVGGCGTTMTATFLALTTAIIVAFAAEAVVVFPFTQAFTAVPTRIPPPNAIVVARSAFPPLASTAVPTAEQLAKEDNFLQQVQYSQTIVPLLVQASSNTSNVNDVAELLEAQLSHGNGIRGFFVTYLTLEGDDTPADQDPIPDALFQAMNATMTAYSSSSSSADELISLACMNVVMPTGMVTMHKEEELARQSQTTAQRGVRVLRALRRINHPRVTEECEAILAVATEAVSESLDAAKVSFWEEFFVKWGYQDTQKRDIARAVQTVLA